MKLPKTLYLNLKTWRCGAGTTRHLNRRGSGRTQLLNREGYSCCLGQWMQQTDKNVNLTLDCPQTPEDVDGGNISTLSKQLNYGRTDTAFSVTCMGINDDENTTIKEKIKKLRAVLKKYRRRLVVRG